MTDEREGLPSASGMYRNVSCSGSENLIRKCKPVVVTTVVAEQGTQIHDALYTGEMYALDDESAEIAEKMKDCATQLFSDWINDKGSLEVVANEERVWIRNPKTLEPIASAKSDKVFVSIDRYALIIDFKTGFLPVTPAEKNWQLRTQAVAVHQEYGATNIRVAIASARLGKPHVDFVDYTLEDLKNAERDLLFQLWKAKQPDAPRHAGEWCKYCPAKAYCREAAAWSAVDVVSPTQTVTSKEQISLAVESMTQEQLVHVWRKRNIVEGVLDAIKARLKALPPEELETLGLRLKEGKKMREIVDKEGVYLSLIGHGFSDIDLFKASKPSIPNLVKHLQSGGYRKPEAEIIIKETLAPYINESRGEPTLEEI